MQLSSRGIYKILNVVWVIPRVKLNDTVFKVLIVPKPCTCAMIFIVSWEHLLVTSLKFLPSIRDSFRRSVNIENSMEHSQKLKLNFVQTLLIIQRTVFSFWLNCTLLSCYYEWRRCCGNKFNEDISWGGCNFGTVAHKKKPHFNLFL